MNPRNVWPAVALAGIAMSVVAVMAIAHVDKDTIFLVASVLVVPVLAALLAAQNADTSSKVATLVAQTNGNQSRQLDIMESQSKMLAGSQPPYVTPAAAPDPAPPEPAP